jgi:hypothetical protein
MEILLKFIESKLQANGLNWLKLLDFRFSPKTKTLAAEVFLEGEDKPLSVSASYTVEGDFLVLSNVETSKRWMTEGIQLLLLKSSNRLPLPTGLKGKMVKMFL